MGKYQIMPGNLGGKNSGWDFEALGFDVTPQQFLSTPSLQEKIASYKLKNTTIDMVRLGLPLLGMLAQVLSKNHRIVRKAKVLTPP